LSGCLRTIVVVWSYIKKDVNENNVDMTVFREVKYIFY